MRISIQPSSEKEFKALNSNMATTRLQEADSLPLQNLQGPSTAFQAIQRLANNSPQIRQASSLQALANANRTSSPSVSGSKSEAPIQLKVSANRLKPGFRSSITGVDTYATWEDAEAAEQAHLQQQLAIRRQERPQVAYQFQPPADEEEGPVEAENPLASALLALPVHFGPVITTGGDVSSAQANALAGQQVIPPTRKTAFSSRNTYAMVFSSLADEFSVHSNTGVATPLSSINYTNHPPVSFYEQHSFMQGKPPAHVHLPDQRSSAHAEALAVHSDAFQSAVEENALNLIEVAEIFGFDPDLEARANLTDEDASSEDDEASSSDKDEGPTEDDLLENLALFLSVPPVSTMVALNRASCGMRGKSGHAGGCNQEMAETAEDYETALESQMDPMLAFLALKTGIASFGVSAAGPYKHQGNSSIMTRHGVDVDVHNSFDWKKGQGKRLSSEQQEYLAIADPEKSRKRRRKKVPPADSPIASSLPKQFDPPPPPPSPGSGAIST